MQGVEFKYPGKVQTPFIKKPATNNFTFTPTHWLAPEGPCMNKKKWTKQTCSRPFKFLILLSQFNHILTPKSISKEGARRGKYTLSHDWSLMGLVLSPFKKAVISAPEKWSSKPVNFVTILFEQTMLRRLTPCNLLKPGTLAWAESMKRNSTWQSLLNSWSRSHYHLAWVLSEFDVTELVSTQGSSPIHKSEFFFYFCVFVLFFYNWVCRPVILNLPGESWRVKCVA